MSELVQVGNKIFVDREKVVAIDEGAFAPTVITIELCGMKDEIESDWGPFEVALALGWAEPND